MCHGPDEQVTKRLHTSGPRLIQWTWFGANWLSGSWVTGSARYSSLSFGPWASCDGPGGYLTITLHISRIKKISVDLIWMGLFAPNPVSGPVRCGADGRNDVGKTRDTNGVIKKWTLATNQCHFGLLDLLVMCFDDVYLISYYIISKCICS